MPFKFNETLWKLGQKIEDDTLPLINKHYECDFKRNENDIFDILDFKDYEVFFVFVFTDKTMEIQLKEDSEFQVKFTGTNCIKHHCIPITDLTEIK